MKTKIIFNDICQVCNGQMAKGNNYCSLDCYRKEKGETNGMAKRKNK